jgi:thiamine kinase-like enzyme
VGHTENIHTIINNRLNELSSKAEWYIEGPVILSRECDIYKAYNSANKTYYAVKQYKPETNAHAITAQYNALLSYQGSMTLPSTTNRIPKIFLCDENNRLIIMEWLNGKRLHDCLWRYALNKSKFLELVFLSGVWISEFHNQKSLTPAYVSDANLIEQLEKRINRYNSTSSVLWEAKFKNAYSTLQTWEKKLASKEIFLGTLHNDYTPTNLIVDEKLLTGIDIWAKPNLPCYTDLARMSVYLLIAYPTIMNTNIINKKLGITPIIKKLIDGYQHKHTAPIDTKILMLFIFAELLRRWVVIADRQSFISKPKTYTKFYQLHRIRKQVDLIQQYLQIT